jgi:hypothetical protein
VVGGGISGTGRLATEMRSLSWRMGRMVVRIGLMIVELVECRSARAFGCSGLVVGALLLRKREGSI